MVAADSERAKRPRSELEVLEQLISVLDAFMARYPGGMKIRGIKTSLLIQRAMLTGDGISVSDLARLTGAPTESVRRHIAKHVELGNLLSVEDPNDARAARVVPANPVNLREYAFAIASCLSRVDWPLFAEVDASESSG